VSDSVATAPNGKGVFGRAIGIIFSPGATFRDALHVPRPAGILFLCCLVISLATGLPQLTERGQQAALDNQVQAIERFTGQTVTPEMYAQMERQAVYGAYGAFVGVFVMMPVFSIIITAVLWVVFNAIMGGTATFKSVLTVVTHSQVIGALGAVVSAPIQYLQGVQSMAGPFNFGALLPMLDPGGFLAMFLGSISVFVLWQLAVCGIGLAVLYKRTVGGVTLGLITVYLVVAAAVVGVISSFTGGSR
jgi:hypothetical protein